MLAPYVWATNIDGSVTVKGQAAPVDASFGDLLEGVDYALQGVVELSSGEGLHLVGDFTYITLDADAEAGPIQVEAGGYIGIYQGLLAHDVGGDPNLQAFVGARYYTVSLRPSLTPGPDVGDVKERWIDPFVGVRKTWPLGEHWSLKAVGDIGGYLGGDSSDLTWQAGLFGVRETDAGHLILGYRVLFVDYETGSGPDKFEFDNTLFGPMVGWVFRF